MWALFKKDVNEALENYSAPETARDFSCVTGVAAYPLIKWAVDRATNKWHNLSGRVFAIENNFFGEKITWRAVLGMLVSFAALLIINLL